MYIHAEVGPATEGTPYEGSPPDDYAAGPAVSAAHPPDWWWLSWVLAIFIVSLGASLSVEAVKGWFRLKATRAWRRAGDSTFAKIGLLFPLLAAFGGLGGAVLFTRLPAVGREGPLVEDWIVAASIGMIAPIFAVPLWETAIFFLGLTRRIVAKRVGATTADIAALERAAHAAVEGGSAEMSPRELADTDEVPPVPPPAA